jgi:hypothetical protein
MVLVATLSIIFNVGLKPRLVRYCICFSKTAMVVSDFPSLTGVARIALVVQSYKINMAVIPSTDRIGNFPVKSTYMVPFCCRGCHRNKRCDFLRLVLAEGSNLERTRLRPVFRVFFLWWIVCLASDVSYDLCQWQVSCRVDIVVRPSLLIRAKW